MRLAHVLLDEVAGTSLVYFLSSTDDPDSSSARRVGRLHDIHVAVVRELALETPTLPIFWQDVGWRAYLELAAEPGPLPCIVTPEIAFVTDAPGARKVINFLEGVHAFKSTRPDEASPQTVPVSAALNNLKACELKSIYDAVVSVRRVIDLERQLTAMLQVLLRIL